jgi:hypothetical protein
MNKPKLKIVDNSKPAEQPLIGFQDLMVYKGVWALCSLDRKKQLLKATHCAMCLIQGPSPMWGVWLIKPNGLKFQRFAFNRADIEKAYPKLVWRRKMSPFNMIEMADVSLEQRRRELMQKYDHAE